jgi:hypothetical protein
VSAIYGILDTAAEAGGEYLGQREFLDTSHKGRSILTRWFRSQIPDVLGEEATTVAENTTAWLFQPANKDKTLADLAKEMPTSMGATLIQSLVGGGLSHITISGLETALDTAAARKRAEVRSQLGDRIGSCPGRAGCGLYRSGRAGREGLQAQCARSRDLCRPDAPARE